MGADAASSAYVDNECLQKFLLFKFRATGKKIQIAPETAFGTYKASFIPKYRFFLASIALCMSFRWLKYKILLAIAPNERN